MQVFRNLRRFLGIGIGLLIIGFCLASSIYAQHLKISIRVVPDAQSRIVVQGSCPPRMNWSFPDAYAGIIGLANRVSAFQVFDGNGNEVSVHKIAAGQFQSAKPASKFIYEMDVAPAVHASDAAMISWLSPERGLLMLRDLLPRFDELEKANLKKSAQTEVTLDLPDNWRAYSHEISVGAATFETVDCDEVVMAVGKNIRESQRVVTDTTLTLIADGHWAFDDKDAMELAANVLKAHREIFGATASRHVTLILFPFPAQTAPEKWSAETRGSTVTLLIGSLPSRVAALAQLSTPLTHELFHLWVPNGLALDGDYDWFYEGFTVYQAARMAVRLDLLTFQEFLNSIARAYDGSIQTDALSLIDASARRFTGGQTSVYSKSQVIAFIYDLRARESGKGRKSLDDVYRRLFRQYQSTAASPQDVSPDGNTAVTNALSAEIGSDDFVRTFIRSPVSINLGAELAPFGLKVEKLGLRTRISVDEKLSKRQHELLRQLGYNEITHAVRAK